MTTYEYKVIPAPATGEKAKGVKTTAERFALGLTSKLNEMAASGWVYVRAETLPCEERKGLTGRETTYQNMLIFRRALPEKEDLPPVVAPARRAAAATAAAEPPVSQPVQPSEPEKAEETPASQEERLRRQAEASVMSPDQEPVDTALKTVPVTPARD